MFTHTLTTYTDPRLGEQYRATVYLDGQWWMEWTGSLDYVTGHLTDVLRRPTTPPECCSPSAQPAQTKGTP